MEQVDSRDQLILSDFAKAMLAINWGLYYKTLLSLNIS